LVEVLRSPFLPLAKDDEGREHCANCTAAGSERHRPDRLGPRPAVGDADIDPRVGTLPESSELLLANDHRAVVGAGPALGSQAADHCRQQLPRMHQMTDPMDALPIVEQTEPLDREDAADVAATDNEIDFDDERDDDQLPLDAVEAREAGVLLDDPETLSEDDD
jgi:hypothetical protein